MNLIQYLLQTDQDAALVLFQGQCGAQQSSIIDQLRTILAPFTLTYALMQDEAGEPLADIDLALKYTHQWNTSRRPARLVLRFEKLGERCKEREALDVVPVKEVAGQGDLAMQKHCRIKLRHETDQIVTPMKIKVLLVDSARAVELLISHQNEITTYTT